MPHQNGSARAVAVAIGLAASSFVAATAAADVLTVCPGGGCDFTTIEAALAAAADGDVIEIAAGTFTPAASLTTAGLAVELRGAVDPGTGEPTTIIDGAGARTILRVEDGETAATRFENLVFTNGAATPVTFPGFGTFEAGGAVFCLDASPSFENCRFLLNTAEIGGAFFGAAFADADPTFLDCRFEMNEAVEGGAVFMGIGGSITLDGCVFVDNAANGGEFRDDALGGAISIVEDVLLAMDDCVLEQNTAALGGAMLIESALVGSTISNTTFRSNVAGDDEVGCFGLGLGGAIFIEETIVTLTGCTFEANDARSACGGAGGHVYVFAETGPSPTFLGCDFLDGGSTSGAVSVEDGATVFENCVFRGSDPFAPLVSNDAGDTTFRFCEIADGAGDGILNSNGGTVTVEDSEIVDNFLIGVLQSDDATLVLRRSTVCGNGAFVDQIVGGSLDVDEESVIARECDDAPSPDLDGNGIVNGADLTILLDAFGSNDPDADLDGNGVVSGSDLTVLLAAWGPVG